MLKKGIFIQIVLFHCLFLYGYSLAILENDHSPEIENTSQFESQTQSRPPFQDGNEGGGKQTDYLIYIASREGETIIDNMSESQIMGIQQDGSYTPQGGVLDFGHTYIVIVNNSNTDLQVGSYTMSASSTLSIGLWWGLNREHGGIWYNSEQQQMANSNGSHDYVALKQYIDLSDISIISAYLLDPTNDDYDLFSYNCTHFAKNIWNSVAVQKVNNQNGWPSKVAESILSYPLNTTVIPYNNFGNVGYYNNGTFIIATNP